MTASPEQLQLMLIDGAIRFATQGRMAIERKDIEGTFNAIDRAQQIVLQLGNGMQRDANPELVDQMLAIFDFIYRRLIDANVYRDVAAVDDAIRILRHQRATWQMIIEKVAKQGEASSGSPAASADDAEPTEGGSLSIEG